ncbi:hypothetical protein [Burkholderia savannae]|uniref:hypothetical protein n=1 Tax=Burkholderia savannae TaxID=1637837 RepID=UPI0012E3BEFF|nr:hypothetical protein [Burkholderia savannae]
MPDASHPSSRRTLSAVRIGFSDANVRAEPMGAVPRGAAREHAVESRAANRRRASRIRDDRDRLGAPAVHACMRRANAAAARRTRVWPHSDSKHSHISIRLARLRASHAPTSAGCIALSNPSGSPPALRRAGATGLQRRSVTILTLSAEVETAPDSALSEAASKHGNLGQPSGGHDMQRALRHGDALAHLIGIVQVVQIAEAVHATANVLVLRPPAGTLFDNGIPRRRSAG